MKFVETYAAMARSWDRKIPYLATAKLLVGPGQVVTYGASGKLGFSGIGGIDWLVGQGILTKRYTLSRK
jgi:hypothetical protein